MFFKNIDQNSISASHIVSGQTFRSKIASKFTMRLFLSSFSRAYLVDGMTGTEKV